MNRKSHLKMDYQSYWAVGSLAEPLIHFAVPFAVFTALGVKPKRALLLSLLALTPDLDVLFHVHRSVTHSLIPLLLVAAPLLALTWRRKPYRNLVILAFMAVSSHLLLDLSGYTPILYPLLQDSFRIAFSCNMHYGSFPALSFNVLVESIPTVFVPFDSLDAPLFTTEGALISLTLLLPTFIEAFKQLWRRSAC